MKTFSEFITETFLLEMPHIMLDDNEVVDLELEVHTRMKDVEFIEYIKHWLNGDTIKSKSPGFSMHINKNAISDFAKKLSKNDFFKSFVIKNYGNDIWKELFDLLKEKF